MNRSRASASNNQSKRKRKNAKEDSCDDESCPSSDSESDRLPPGPSNAPPPRQPQQPDNSTSQCNRCSSVFYFPSRKLGAPSLCPACIKLSTVVQEKPKPKGRIKRAEDVTLVESFDSGLLSLHDLCIKLISKYIDQVECLGDISDASREKLCLILSRHRKLNDQTVRLLFDARLIVLKLFDCARLGENGLESIAIFNPNLEELVLKECGRMSDLVVGGFAARLTQLKSLNLCGAYLVSDAAFANLVDSLSAVLEDFAIDNSPKLSTKTLQSLQRCGSLKTLALTNCSAVRDEDLRECFMAVAGRLESLDLTNCHSITDGAFISSNDDQDGNSLLAQLGLKLKRLRLAGQSNITDAMLKELSDNCTLIEELTLDNLTQISGGEQLGCLLQSLNSLNCFSCSSNAHFENFSFLCNLEGKQLKELRLNGLRGVDREMLLNAIKGLHMATHVDVSWISSVDDECLELIMERCASNSSRVHVFGCTQLTDIALEFWDKERPNIKITGSPYIQNI